MASADGAFPRSLAGFQGFGGLPDPSVDDLVRGKLSIFDLESPVAVVDQGKLQQNIETMNGWCRSEGVKLAPHTKTTMTPKIIELQRQSGVWGFTVATPQHLRALRALGLLRVIVANQLASQTAATQLLECNRTAEVLVFADSVAGVDLLAAAAQQTPSHPLGVLVEVGASGGRAGVRAQGTAIEVAEAVRTAPGLVLRGVSGFEGILGRDRSPATYESVASYVQSLAGIANALINRGHFDGGGPPPLVSVGGSAYFDIVVEGLSELRNSGAEIVLRSGCYVVHDSGLYDRVSPLRAGAGVPELHAAIHVWAQVISKPEDDLVVLNAGRREHSTDIDPPLATQLVASHSGNSIPLPDSTVVRISDHHLVLRLSEPVVEIGDWIQLGVSHPCTTFDKWRLITLVDGHMVVDVALTCF